MPPIKRFSFNGSFVERVNSVMISGKEVARPEQKQPVRVRAIIANTKLSEREMRERFAEALQTTECAEDSTSTENLIDAYEVDYNEEGLISLCRKLIAENVRLSDVIWSIDKDTIEALGFANREIERLTTSENDWITCHAKIWRELQETKTIVGNQAERISDLEASPISEEVIDILRSKIKALESEILEQCRINGMGAEREAALLGKVAQQSAALKLAWEALGEVQDLIGESHGVYGLHLNGDESPWGELEQGGRFERLTLLNEALAAIDNALGE